MKFSKLTGKSIFFQSINFIVRPPNFDPYSVLNLPRTASKEDVTHKYQRLSADPIPTHIINRDSLNSMEELFEAYSILNDDACRAAFDQYGMPGVIHFEHTGSLPLSLAPTFFNEKLPGSSTSRVQKHGPATYCNLDIDLVESINGCEKNIPITTSEACTSCSGTGQLKGKPQTSCKTCSGRGTQGFGWNNNYNSKNCPDCSGSGSIIDDPCPSCSGLSTIPTQRTIKITIPKNTKNGSFVTVHNEGEPNIDSGLRGSIYFQISVSDKIFTLEGKNIHTILPIALTTAIEGGSATIPSPHGGQISVKIPAGSENDSQIIVKGKGIGGGDLIINLSVAIPIPPQKLSPEETASITKL